MNYICFCLRNEKTTMNCTLRALEPRDVSALIEAENHQDSYMISDNFLPFSEAVLKKYLEGEHDLLKYHQYRYAVDYKNECVGFIDLFDYNPIHSRAGVGVYIFCLLYTSPSPRDS